MSLIDSISDGPEFAYHRPQKFLSAHCQQVGDVKKWFWDLKNTYEL